MEIYVQQQQQEEDELLDGSLRLKSICGNRFDVASGQRPVAKESTFKPNNRALPSLRQNTTISQIANNASDDR